MGRQGEGETGGEQEEYRMSKEKKSKHIGREGSPAGGLIKIKRLGFAPDPAFALAALLQPQLPLPP